MNVTCISSIRTDRSDRVIAWSSTSTCHSRRIGRLAAAMALALAAVPTVALADASAGASCDRDAGLTADSTECRTPIAGTAQSRTFGIQATVSNDYIKVDGRPNSDATTTGNGGGNIAIGSAAVVDSGTTFNTSSVSIGPNSRVHGAGSAAFGNGASVGAAGAYVDRSVAIGGGSSVSATEAVALGVGSVADTANTVSVGNATLQRRIVNLAAGDLNGTSTDAVNGSQLFATNEAVKQNAADIRDTTTALTALDGRVTSAEGDISQLSQQFNALSTGAAGMVAYDAASGSVTVGAQVGGATVNLAGTGGERRLVGVANGIDDSDAVTLAQLKASGLVDPNNGRALGALVYDDLSLDRATLGGTHGTVIGNLGNGLIAAGSREAVNGGQLWQLNADWESRWNDLDSRVGSVEHELANGNVGTPAPAPGPAPDLGGSGDHSVAIGTGSGAAGTGAIGIGNGSNAEGTGSIAIGDGATATGHNAVAIGAGATADRDNEFSVGSQGNERVVSNVAAGTRPTDAVNLGQMEDRFAAERDWANGRFQAVDARMDRMGAMNAAMVNMAVSAAGVRTTHRVGAGVGFQNGKSALSVGYQQALSERATITLGGSFSGSEASAGFGAGFGW